MTTLDESQRKAAKIAGISCLFIMAVVVFANFGIHERLIVAGNAAETARNVLAHQTLFRIGIACGLIYSAGLVVLLSALYVILKPVSQGIAMFAALGRLIYALMWLLMTLNLFEGLRVFSGAEYLRAIETDQLQALGSLYLRERFDVYYVGLMFYALASTVCSYLWLKSHYIPRAFAVFGVISSAFCIACTLVFIIDPDFTRIVNLWWFDSPMAIFEMLLSVWLLVKGLKPESNAERLEKGIEVEPPCPS